MRYRKKKGKWYPLILGSVLAVTLFCSSWKSSEKTWPLQENADHFGTSSEVSEVSSFIKNDAAPLTVVCPKKLSLCLFENQANPSSILQNYQHMSLTYSFGDTTEVLDSEEILSWLYVSNGNVEVNEEQARAFVSDLATHYNTIYKTRKFQTTSGETVAITENEYGFKIDVDEETKQLIEDIKNNIPIQREPVYSKTGLSRNGMDDLNGSYIEISLDQQHLWLYSDGDLVTETDIISGLPTEDRATYTGAWPIAYKAENYTLTSEQYGYSTTVRYWMPFVCGQGLHDADWQDEFGGDVYKTKGSHGCINLPPDQAERIYHAIRQGFPVIIYDNNRNP